MCKAFRDCKTGRFIKVLSVKVRTGEPVRVLVLKSGKVVWVDYEDAIA